MTHVANERGADRKRIDISQDRECRYWSERFHVSPDELKRLVKKVGPMVDDVARVWVRPRSTSYRAFGRSGATISQRS